MLVDRDGSLTIITLNRPRAANALDLDLVARLDAAVQAAASDERCHAVLLRGAGARFCVGGDVMAMGAASDRGAFLDELAGAAHAVIGRLDALTKPVVAAVQGSVAGAGLALALSADLILACESTTFVTAYTAIGLTPDCGTSWLLPRAIGMPRALELTLTNRALTAQEALDWGLVARVCPSEELADQARDLAMTLAGPTGLALGATRRLIRDGATQPLASTLDAEQSSIAAFGVGSVAGGLIGKFLARS